MDNVLIEVKGLKKNYGRNTALQGLDFEICRGEIFGLFGPNGAGKSTLISILATLIKPTEGDVLVNGVSVRNRPDRIRTEIGFVPQEIALYPMLTGRDNLNFWAGIYGISGKLRNERVNEAIAVARLEDRIMDRVSEYSGGMKRRLNIAVSLLHHPRILLMDEPTVGVDVQSRRYILDTLETLKKNGITIVLSSHYVDELETLCDRIAIMDKGKILALGAADELKKSYGVNDLETVLFRLLENGRGSVVNASWQEQKQG